MATITGRAKQNREDYFVKFFFLWFFPRSSCASQYISHSNDLSNWKWHLNSVWCWWVPYSSSSVVQGWRTVGT